MWDQLQIMAKALDSSGFESWVVLGKKKKKSSGEGERKEERGNRFGGRGRNKEESDSRARWGGFACQDACHRWGQNNKTEGRAFALGLPEPNLIRNYSELMWP